MNLNRNPENLNEFFIQTQLTLNNKLSIRLRNVDSSEYTQIKIQLGTYLYEIEPSRVSKWSTTSQFSKGFGRISDFDLIELIMNGNSCKIIKDHKLLDRIDIHEFPVNVCIRGGEEIMKKLLINKL